LRIANGKPDGEVPTNLMGMQIHLRFKSILGSNSPLYMLLLWLGVSLEVEIQKMVLKIKSKFNEFLNFASMT
jgi:hypothetical protein